MSNYISQLILLIIAKVNGRVRWIVNIEKLSMKAGNPNKKVTREHHCFQIENVAGSTRPEFDCFQIRKYE